MEQLIIYDIQLSDGRQDEMWVESDEHEDTYARLELTPAVLQKVIETEVEPYFGCKVLKYKWTIEDDEEEFDDWDD